MDLKNIRKSLKQAAGELGNRAQDASGNVASAISQKMSDVGKEKIKDVAVVGVENAKNVAGKATSIVKTGVSKSAETIGNVMDVNGDGQVDIEDLIILGLRVPGIQINRNDFLRTEFKKHYSDDVITDAIINNPAHAGISVEEIDKYADEVIKFERNCVSGISAALSTPGGVTGVATTAADITQYYGYMLRVAQKLLYLYGFPEIDVSEKGKQFDTETLNILTLCLGVMYGVAGASNGLKAVAKMLGNGVQKQMMKKALTKGTIYPIVKSVSKWFGVRMTKEIYTGFFKHAVVQQIKGVLICQFILGEFRAPFCV